MVDTYVSGIEGFTGGVACASVPLAGGCGCGVGEHGVAGVAPARAGVGEGIDDDGCFLVVLGGLVVVVDGAPPDDAGVAQDAEGDRVAAALGEEVAAEAEHVRPPAQR